VTDPDPDPEKTLRGDPTIGGKLGIIERLRDQAVDVELAWVKQRLNNPELSDQERLDLFKRRQILPELKKQPLAPTATISSGQPAD
jgi:hypothetical protein